MQMHDQMSGWLRHFPVVPSSDLKLNETTVDRFY